ncbi:MAG: Rrf2 family transcriptional regulator [Emcibacter sp.]|nr:Rrf2 family transcriptional regulator [Emcibacter sp.]
MKLQRSSRLALYSILELASHPDTQLSASDIAAKFDVSLNHLAKVLRDLGRTRMVEAVRGAGGG